MNRSVVAPEYYVSKDRSMQLWDMIHILGMDFFQANVCKYVYRYKSKNGLQDLQKARAYIDKMIEIESAKNEDKSRL